MTTVLKCALSMVIFSSLVLPTAYAKDTPPAVSQESQPAAKCLSPSASGGLIYPEVTHKLGDLFLRIPSRHESPTLSCAKEVDSFQLTVCWPNLVDELRNCTPVPGSNQPVTGRMQIVLTFLGNQPFRNTSSERLAEIASKHEGPFDVPGTLFQQYRIANRHQAAYYTFVKEGTGQALRIADCSNGYTCSVRGVRYQRLALKYVFPVEHIENWPDIEQAVISYVSTLIVPVD